MCGSNSGLGTIFGRHHSKRNHEGNGPVPRGWNFEGGHCKYRHFGCKKEVA